MLISNSERCFYKFSNLHSFDALQIDSGQPQRTTLTTDSNYYQCETVSNVCVFMFIRKFMVFLLQCYLDRRQFVSVHTEQQQQPQQQQTTDTFHLEILFIHTQHNIICLCMRFIRASHFTYINS